MLRSTNLIALILATTPFAVIDGYNNLRGIITPYNVGLVHFEGIQLSFKELGLCNPHIGMETYLEMGNALFEVLETYLPHKAIVLTLIGHIKSKDKDGYKLLWEFPSIYVPIINSVIPNNAPTLRKHEDIQTLSWVFEQYYHLVRMSGTDTSEVVMSRSFLMAIIYASYTHSAFYSCNSWKIVAICPTRFQNSVTFLTT